jgi:hypothetical protein
MQFIFNPFMGSLIGGIISGLLASVIFLALLIYRFRPQIDISNCIAQYEEDGATVYRVKIVNRICRNAINIKIELDLVTAHVIADGTEYRAEHLHLKTPEWMLMPKYNPKDEKALWALRLRINEDLQAIWNDDSQFLFLRVYAEDEWSNLGRVFSSFYRKKNVHLKKGQFRSGLSMEVV